MVLDFWTTWCQPCVDELPDLVRPRRRGGPVPAAELQEKALSLIGPARDGGRGGGVLPKIDVGLNPLYHRRLFYGGMTLL